MMYPADGMTLILNPKPSGDSATSTSHRSYPESISGVPSNATHPEQVQEAGTAQDAVCGTHHVGQASDMPKPSAIFVTAENPTTVKETFRGRNSNAHEGATAHEDTDAAVLPSAMVMKDAFPMEHRHSAVSESNLEGAQGAPVNRQRWDLCHIVETVVFEMTSGSNFTQSDAISEHFEPTEAQRDIASKLDNLVVQDMDAMMGGYQKGKRDLAIVTRIKQLAAEITRNAKYPPRHHKVPRGSVELGLTHDLHSIGEPLACVLLCHTTRCVGTDYYQVFDRMWKIASLVDEEIAVQLKSLSAPSGSAESSSGYSKTRDGIYDFINKSKRMQTSPLRRMPRHEAFRLDRWANHLAIWAVREGIIDVKR